MSPKYFVLTTILAGETGQVVQRNLLTWYVGGMRHSTTSSTEDVNIFIARALEEILRDPDRVGRDLYYNYEIHDESNIYWYDSKHDVFFIDKTSYTREEAKKKASQTALDVDMNHKKYGMYDYVAFLKRSLTDSFLGQDEYGPPYPPKNYCPVTYPQSQYVYKSWDDKWKEGITKFLEAEA